MSWLLPWEACLQLHLLIFCLLKSPQVMKIFSIILRLVVGEINIVKVVKMITIRYQGLLLLVYGKPKSFSDMKREGRTWKLSSVKSNEGDSASLDFTVKKKCNIYSFGYDSMDLKKKLAIGIISPYATQVASIQYKLAHKYEKLDGFSVTVKSTDGFQGREEDIIILSTARSNSHGYCLWILVNERTLTNIESIWKEVVCDARNRHCLFDADADECLKMIIIAAMKELEQLDDLVNMNSILFKHAKWKVLISDEFRRSFRKLTGSRLKKKVLNLLLKLSSGWRPKNRSVDLCCESSSQILKQFKVEGIYAIYSIDIIKKVKYIQVLKVWDILALEDILELKKRLESIYFAYTDDYINWCTEKCLEGTWPVSQEIIRFRYSKDCKVESEASVNPSEILLLMKFYSFSHGVVSHLLSGKDVDLPMQVTDEQMDIILSRKSSFIIGRSGTGKTNILTMKLFQHEHKFQIASDGIFEAKSSRFGDAEVVDNPRNSKPSVLCQLFVSVNPRLCYAVKQHVSHLTSSSAEVNIDDADVIPSEFDDIADTFINIPVKNYPFVITFQKFLMMLDGTLESSFFDRFRKASEDSHEFLYAITSEMQEKGLVSEIKQLKQNCRTHAGVLDLAQSVIDMMYHYYIQSIDKLEPEISLISGEPPVLLESRNDENAIVAIFGGSGNGKDFVGFGAEQVILVRDDRTKTEVCEFVGKNALVLTIVECKGLEF
uniref:UvrD-like helicase, ATP-binding domain, P-loop containing nucleoside triphosphate hydrolase n=1 Tax=Tanacetum cinerariifolium TaxID=118510 RepID=A0A6L2L7W4_TANCI|nr:UvrD-like helicase, ATP-binding domain, P-loop containing nucleoside triphosphate hydrolase [Tanacetum cinerariifolium]